MTDDHDNSQIDAKLDLALAQSNAEHSRYSTIKSSWLYMQTWTFRLAIVVIAYVTVALCNWLLMPSSSPFLDAIPPAAGVLIGFLALRLIGMSSKTS
jgi:hypothetical protein